MNQSGQVRFSSIYFLLAGMATLFLFFHEAALAQWASQPGATMRNAFGPELSHGARVCRGACGVDCPSSCTQVTSFECNDSGGLTKVRSYECGTHAACREHDDCLDLCSIQNAEGYDCETQCHMEIVEAYGVESAGSWALGGGPYDAKPILFEYTRDAPESPEAGYTCPEGAKRVCGEQGASCVVHESTVDPVFQAYSGGNGGLLISDFRSGRVCLEQGNPASVCEQAVDIQIDGQHRCLDEGGEAPCSWYGFELDYRNADPSQPLVCHSSSGEEDFLGNIVSGLIKAAPAEPGTELGDMLGQFQKELGSGASLQDIFSGVQITTAEGEVLGGEPAAPPKSKPGVPREVPMHGVNGHLLVPMYEMRASAAAGTVVETELRCTHGGVPVLETTYRLHFAAR